MKRIFFLSCFSVLTFALSAQTVYSKLTAAFRQFEKDPQLKHAISSLYIIDAKTGKVVFNKNSEVGLAGASTQKIFTACAAFDLLGKDFRYKTVFSGNSSALYVKGFGDPTFGSWRYNETVDTSLFNEIIAGLQKAGIKDFKKLVVYDDPEDRLLPSGWINEDMGNYYGAGAHRFNWHENQYDLIFIPGKHIGEPAALDTTVTFDWQNFINDCKTGGRGSGDNAYIYFIPGDTVRLIKGTVPEGYHRFTITGSDPSPARTFSLDFLNYAASKNFFSGNVTDFSTMAQSASDNSVTNDATYIHYSPALDSIIFWFLRKSVNLYGEALAKTIAYEKKGISSTVDGVDIIKYFWKQRGIDENEISIEDGSGLSPQNRVTTHAQVEALKYAKSKDWFPYFYDALPEYNNMKMKSGTISGVKGFAGYQTSKAGNQYIFSFLVNNYHGSPESLVNKMYKVLNILK